MADRDQNWGFGGGRGQGGGWREDERRRRERERPDEGRSFGGDDRRFEGGEPWRGEGRYGARYDQDRAYGGQEYGMETGRSRRAERRRHDEDERETWRPDQGQPYGDLELNPRNRGVREFGPPSDYAYHPQAGHEFDPDYLHWREEQMRTHDRDYHEWRRNQRQAYDDDYRRFRTERRSHFSRSFQDWRSQRSLVGGIPDTTVVPGVSGYGDRVGQPPTYGANPAAMSSGVSGPSPPTGESQSGQSLSRGDGTPEFGREPPQVQATASGWDGRGAPEDRTDRAREEARREAAKREEDRRDHES